MEVRCPYCNEPAKLVTGRSVYPHRRDLFKLKFYVCVDCDARCGCHPGTSKPLGSLANGKTRRARREAHERFDRIWKTKKLSRSEAYSRLAAILGITGGECHIGMFDVEQCAKVIEAAREIKRQLNECG